MIIRTLATAAVLLAAAPADVKVTQKYLSAVCVNGAATGDRHWRMEPRAQELVFTMRNDPRQGVAPHQQAPKPGGSPGFATVRFTPEAGHKYEVEVRAPATAYSWRVWERGQWTPVVRDRTAEKIVSGDPEWSDRAACQR